MDKTTASLDMDDLTRNNLNICISPTDVAKNSSEAAILSVDARSASTTLTKILAKYMADAKTGVGNVGMNFQICGLAVSAMGGGDERYNHMALRKFIISKNLQNDELFKKYLEEFEEYHYVINDIGTKIWRDDKEEVHRETKDANGLTLPAIIRTNGAKTWCKHGKEHRTDKAMVNGRLETLPSYIDGRERVWKREGEYFRDDVDEFGNLLPTEINSTGGQYWYQNNRSHRAELGKNPANDDFGYALPAVIYSNGQKSWRFNGNDISRDKLTSKLSGTQTSIQALIKHYKKCIKKNTGNMADNYNVVSMLLSAHGDHLKLKKWIEAQNLATDELWAKYLVEYEEYHYTFSTTYKVWKNKKGKWHRTTKGLDGMTLPAYIGHNGATEWHVNGACHREDIGPDGLTLPASIRNGDQFWYINGKNHRSERGADGKTLPAKIYSNGDKYWYINGENRRDDVDEFGNSLPTLVKGDGEQVWRTSQYIAHRMELGKNPADADFGKALPAIIRANGEKNWYLNECKVSQDYITEKLTGEKNVDCSGYKSVKIVLKNGEIVAHDIVMLTLLQ